MGSEVLLYVCNCNNMYFVCIIHMYITYITILCSYELYNTYHMYLLFLKKICLGIFYFGSKTNQPTEKGFISALNVYLPHN